MTYTYNPFPQVVIVKDTSNPTYMGVDILVAFRNHCPTPYTYDETLQTCVMCMTNCDECDGT